MQFQFIFYILAGIFSGVVAGMGMGGGTILIPILTLFLGVSQKLSQAINLIVFLPISVVVLCVYFRKNLIEKHVWWLVSLPASIVALAISFLIPKINSRYLQIAFGCFLIILAIFQFVILIKNKTKNYN